MISRTTPRLPLVAVAVSLALALAGCATPSVEAESSATTQAAQVSMSDAWVKAAAEGDMTAAFGVLSNDGDAEVTLVSVSSEASLMMQLHETVDDGSGTMTMQEKEGGFALAPGASLALEPGGNHVMFMGLAHDVVAGDELSLVFTFADGSSFEVTAPVKDYSGANETYRGDTDGMDEMDMDGMGAEDSEG